VSDLQTDLGEGAAPGGEADKRNADRAGPAAAIPPADDIELDEQIYLPAALAPNPDPVSYMACTVVTQTIEEAHYLMCHDCCLVCGSSGRGELMLFCVDCGEAVHSFCVEAPLSTMPEEARATWRCLNCRVCRICTANSENPTVGKMLYCEGCDGAFHSNCLQPPVTATPEGSWFCAACVKCVGCTLLSPDGKPRECWGFETNMCFSCHQLAEEEKRAQEARAREQALRDLQQNTPSNCNLCYTPYEGQPVMMCTGCGRNSHVSCNLPNAVPTVKNDLECYRDFLCKRCVVEYLPGCSSHIGSGVPAAALLEAVARIQRARRVRQQAADERRLIGFEQERRETYNRGRPLLRAVVSWAAMRAHWFQTFSGATPGSTPSLPLSNFASARAVRFLSLWRRQKGQSGVSAFQRRQNLMRGLDEDGQEMDGEKLVRMASLGAAFLEMTHTEVRKYLDRDAELTPVLEQIAAAIPGASTLNAANLNSAIFAKFEVSHGRYKLYLCNLQRYIFPAVFLAFCDRNAFTNCAASPLASKLPLCRSSLVPASRSSAPASAYPGAMVTSCTAVRWCCRGHRATWCGATFSARRLCRIHRMW
jgi:zinc finger protein ubi-d4